MDYLRNSLTTATNYLGLTGENQEGHAITQDPIPASEMQAKNELNKEIVERGGQTSSSSLPDTSSKAGLHQELLNANKDDLLHQPSDRLAAPSEAKTSLHKELLSTDKNELLHHASSSQDSELRSAPQDYQPVALQSHPEYDFEQRSLDRNGDGKIDSRDFAGQQGLAQRNPLDRNGDGKVDSRDFTGQSGYGQQGLAGAQHNPLDRNFDGKVDSQDFAGQSLNQNYNQSTYVQSAQRGSTGIIRAEPTKMETIQKEVVVHERIHPVQKEEIQPIIYREREQLDVKQVTQMMHETQIQPTLVEQRSLPAEYRQDVIQRGVIPENIVHGSTEVDAVTRTQVVHAPIVNEILKKTVVEEVQPVLERDVYAPTVVQTTVPIYEKIIEAPRVYREEIITTGQSSEYSNRRLSSGYQSQNLAQNLSQQNLSQQNLAQPQSHSQSQYSQSSTYSQPQLSQNTYSQSQGYPQSAEYSNRRLSSGYQSQNLAQNLSQQSTMVSEQRQYPVQLNNANAPLVMQQQQLNSLPTGQVLPSVTSSRPEYSYLPPNYAEKRPDFIGTGAQYAMASKSGKVPSTQLQGGLYNPYVNRTQ